MNRLSELLAEQSSPAEVLVFLAVSVVVFLAIAFLIYLLIMAVLRLGLPEKVPLRRVLLPSSERVKENFGDYVLAISTSALLSVTLIVKHDLVEQIQNYDMGEVRPEAVAILFDYGLPRELADRIGEGTLDEVVRPLLQAGRVEESDRLVRSIVARLPPGWVSPPVLIVSCIVLAAFYVVWLARRRYKTLKKKPDSAPEYKSTFRPLMTLALCVGLLLASAVPFARGGEKFLARSALDAIEAGAGEGVPSSELSRLLSAELRKQRERAVVLFCPECERISGSIRGDEIPGAVRPGDPDALLAGLDEAVAACRESCASEAVDLASTSEDLRRRQLQLENQVNDLVRQFSLFQQRQPALFERLLAAERERIERQLAELNGRLGELSGELGAARELRAVVEDLQRRVAWLESQHQPRGELVEREPDPVCQRYAANWVRQSKAALEFQCNVSGDRWSTDVKIQFAACQNMSRQMRNRETEARDVLLRNCRTPVQ